LSKQFLTGKTVNLLIKTSFCAIALTHKKTVFFGPFSKLTMKKPFYWLLKDHQAIFIAELNRIYNIRVEIKL